MEGAPGREKSMCKGPEAGRGFNGSRDRLQISTLHARRGWARVKLEKRHGLEQQAQEFGPKFKSLMAFN